MINALVTAVGGDIGQGIIKSLRLYREKINITGTDINPESPGLFMCDQGYIIPPAREKNKYLKIIEEICLKENIDILFSAQPLELDVLCGAKKRLMKNTRVKFIIQEKKVWDSCADKYKMYEFLSGTGIRTPETAATKEAAERLAEKFGFPIIVKPKTGSGSRGFTIIKNKQDLIRAWHAIDKPIAQEYITNENGDEYTVGVFLDKKSEALGAIPMLRKLRFGLTVHAIIDDYSEVSQAAIAAAERVGAIGPCNVQIRMDANNTPCVIEINARISSTTIFRAKLGFNETAAAIDYFLKNKTPHLKYKPGVVMKTWDELIISSSRYSQLLKNKHIFNEQ